MLHDKVVSAIEPMTILQDKVNAEGFLVNNELASNVSLCESSFYPCDRSFPTSPLVDNGFVNDAINISDYTSREEDNFSITLNKIRIKNLHRIIIAQININSIRNKFEFLFDAVSENIDILFIFETKLDSSFPKAQFFVKGFTEPYRLDRNRNGGGIMIYIREDIPSKILTNANMNIEALFVELNVRKKKWLICGSYNPHSSSISTHLKQIGNSLDLLLTNYDNLICVGDFNVEATETSMIEFCQLYSLKHLIKTPTCFKNPENPKCIDLILTNSNKSFQHSNVIETGLSDFHKMVITVMKIKYPKQTPKIVNYRNYKKFENVNFRDDIVSRILPNDSMIFF